MVTQHKKLVKVKKELVISKIPTDISAAFVQENDLNLVEEPKDTLVSNIDNEPVTCTCSKVNGDPKNKIDFVVASLNLPERERDSFSDSESDGDSDLVEL